MDSFNKEHTDKAFAQELKEKILKTSSKVEEMIAKSIQAFVDYAIVPKKVTRKKTIYFSIPLIYPFIIKVV